MTKYYYTYNELFGDTTGISDAIYLHNFNGPDRIKRILGRVFPKDTYLQALEDGAIPDIFTSRSDYPEIIEELLRRIEVEHYKSDTYFYSSNEQMNIKIWRVVGSKLPDYSLSQYRDFTNYVYRFLEKIRNTSGKYIDLITGQIALKKDILKDIENSTTTTSSNTSHTEGTSSNTNSSNVNGTDENFESDTPQTPGTYTGNSYVSKYNKLVKANTQTGSNDDTSSQDQSGSSTTTSVSKTSLGTVSEKLQEIERAMEDYYDKWVKEFDCFKIYL